MKTKHSPIMATIFYLLFSLLLTSATVSAKGIFKCIKPNGEVEYTQKASKDCDAQQIKKRGGHADPKAVEKLQQNGKWSKIADEEKRQAAQQKRDDERAKKEKEQYCKELKANFKQIRNTTRVFETGSDGKRIKLTEEQRQQRVQQNQQSMDTHCK